MGANRLRRTVLAVRRRNDLNLHRPISRPGVRESVPEAPGQARALPVPRISSALQGSRSLHAL
jgi:hypothetical protein